MGGSSVMTRYRRFRRNILTSVALGTWLFAVLVSAAHACGPGILHGGHGGLSPPVAAQDHETEAVKSAAVTASEPLCVAAPTVIPSRAFHAPQVDQPAAVATSPSYLTLAARIATAPAVLDRPDPPPSIALYTRFLRLAL